MSFMTLPPEINSLRMFSGAGSAPMLEAAAAWDGLASELGSAASSFSSVTSGLAGQAWQGPSAQAMTAAAAPYTGWLSQAAAQASGAAWAGPGGGQCVRGGPRGHDPSAGGGGQPQFVRPGGEVELVWAQRARDRRI